jgi:hypothetical protein
MITGYNTDVPHASLVFHVQTEDKGVASASIESLVYVGGQILGKRRTSYRDVLDRGEGKGAIVELMDRQHRLMIAEIRSGKYDRPGEGGAAPLEEPPLPPDEQRAPAPPGSLAAGVEPAATPPQAGGVQVQTLDQIILEYLNSEAEQEHLVLMMDVDREFELGRSASLRFRTKGSITGKPVPGTRVSLKMISTVSEPVTLASGETDANGELGLSVDIPDFQRGSSALIVSASSEIGRAEIKHLL